MFLHDILYGLYIGLLTWQLGINLAYSSFAGGHNLLILAHGLGHYVQLGTTIDDAIGEAYDKTARLLGLDMGRGGGPALEELAREGDANSVKFSVRFLLDLLNARVMSFLLITFLLVWYSQITILSLNVELLNILICLQVMMSLLQSRFQWGNIRIAISHMLV